MRALSQTWVRSVMTGCDPSARTEARTAPEGVTEPADAMSDLSSPISARLTQCMRTYRPPLAAFVILIGACSGADDGNEPEVPASIAVPTVAQAAGSTVSSPWTVNGTAVAGDEISLSFRQNGTTLATATAVANSSGIWSATLTFTGVAGAAQLSATASRGGQTSSPVVVDVTISGSSADPNPDPNPNPDPAPGAVSLFRPTVDQVVTDRVEVRGTGVASATVAITLIYDSRSIAEVTTVADSGGAFQTVIALGDQVPYNGVITVSVVQITPGGTSPPVTVEVTRARPVQITGALTHASATAGDRVFVRAYLPSADGLEFVGDAVVAVTANATVAATYTLHVPPGTYVVRAFRDDGGPFGAAPDGEPTLGIDPQAPGLTVAVSDAGVVRDLALADAGFAGDTPHFDVFTRNESASAGAPYAWDDEAEDWVEGEGLCYGYYLRIEVDYAGATTAPRVRRPNGEIVDLLDDGGCGDTADNRAQSYDQDPDDDRFSLGIPAPTTAMSGEYRFAFIDEASGHIGVLVDSVSTIRKLSRRVTLISPTGAAAVGVARPTFTWAAVENATAYNVHLWSPGDENMPLHWSSDPSVALTQDLIDGVAYEVRINAADGNRSLGEDVDAEASGLSNYFVVDIAGTHSMTINGTIQNALGDLEAPIWIEAGFDEDNSHSPHASVWLDHDATGFTLTVLRSRSATGYVMAFVDADGSGDDDDANRSYREYVSDLTFDGTPPSPEIIFDEPIVLVAPSQGQVISDPTPTFSWQSYPSAPAGPWSWVLFLADETYVGEEGPPPNLYGVPSSATSHTLGAPMKDIGMAARCFMAHGDQAFNPDTWTCDPAVDPSIDALVPGEWEWGLAIIPCDIEAANYVECVAENLQDDSDLTVSAPLEFVVQ